MDIVWMLLLVGMGFVLIVKGGDIFVESSVTLARVAHVRELIIGATIVSIGTTLPEFFSSLLATIRGVGMGGDEGYYALAVSNAIGSMMCNSGLILAPVLIIRPPRYSRHTFNRSAIYVLVYSVLIVIFVMTGSRVSRLEGIVLLMLFILFMMSSVMHAREGECQMLPMREEPHLMRTILGFLIGGISISVGALLLVDNARALALRAGVSEQLLGITLVAVGTSLPELVTSMTALRRGNTEVGVGNILGAHVINGTLIMGIISVISGGMAVDDITRNVASIVMLSIMVILILPTIVRHRFSRMQGIVMLALYLSFIVYNAKTGLST